MGLGGQLIHWPAGLVQGLADAGYRVLRFSYTEVVYNWPAVEAAIARALAQQLHLQH